MMTDLALPVAAVLLTYLVHSTLLLAAAWLIDRTVRHRSPALRQWLWKTAAVAPLLTSCSSSSSLRRSKVGRRG